MSTKADPAVAPAAKTGAAQRKADAAAPATKAFEPLKRQAIQLEEFQRYRWIGFVPAGLQPEDLDQNPPLWSVVGDVLHPYDIVALVSKDGGWYAEYLVSDCGPGYAAAQMLFAKDLPPRLPDGLKALPAGFEIRRGEPGSNEPWQVIRLEDGFIFNAGNRHETFEQARAWLLAHAIHRDPDKVEYLP